MTEQEIDALYAYAGKLVADRKSLSGVFAYYTDKGYWVKWNEPNKIPLFEGGDEWRITTPKKQPINWSHEYFKGCATDCGDVVLIEYGSAYTSRIGMRWAINSIRLATPANEHANWQPFFSTPENDAKLRELAKMVKVEVRWSHLYGFTVSDFETFNLDGVCNFRSTGLQEGWTDNPEEAKA